MLIGQVVYCFSLSKVLKIELLFRQSNFFELYPQVYLYSRYLITQIGEDWSVSGDSPGNHEQVMALRGP